MTPWRSVARLSALHSEGLAVRSALSPMNPAAAIRASLGGAPMIGGVIRATVSAALGDLDGLFAEPGPVYEARVEIHRDADVPGGAWLLRQGRSVDALVRIAPSGDAARPRTICLKVPDAYGRGRDQDLLLGILRRRGTSAPRRVARRDIRRALVLVSLALPRRVPGGSHRCPATCAPVAMFRCHGSGTRWTSC